MLFLSKEREYRSHKSDTRFLSFILENRYIYYIFALFGPFEAKFLEIAIF